MAAAQSSDKVDVAWTWGVAVGITQTTTAEKAGLGAFLCFITHPCTPYLGYPRGGGGLRHVMDRGLVGRMQLVCYLR